MAAPRTRVNGLVHALAPAGEHPRGNQFVYGYHRLLCFTPFDPGSPPLPAAEPVTCPKCARKTTKEN